MEESGPSLLYLYAHFLSWRTSETNSRAYSYTFTHLRTHKHAHTCTLWYSLLFFLSFSFSLSLSLSHTQSTSTLYAQMATAICSVCFGTLAAFLTVGTFDANIKEGTDSAQSRFSTITCALSGTTWLQQANVATCFCSTSKWRKHYRVINSTIIENLPCLSIRLSAPHPHPHPTPPPSTQTHTTVVACIFAGDNILRWATIFMCRKTRHILSLLKCCFTSTESVGLLGTGGQDAHLDFHTTPALCIGAGDSINLYAQRQNIPPQVFARTRRVQLHIYSFLLQLYIVISTPAYYA